MNCEYCSRNLLLHSYCYFSVRHNDFFEITNKPFTAVNFCLYAVEMELTCITRTQCKYKTYTEMSKIWVWLQPVYTDALRVYQDSQGI